jgi:hypothetical protein
MDCIENDPSNNSSWPRDVFTELLPSNDRGIHRQTHRLSLDKTWTAQKMMRLTILLLLCVFVVVGMCFPCRWLTLKGGIHIQTHKLMGELYDICHSNELGYHATHTKFHKYWFRHSKVDRGGIHRHADSMEIA